MPVQVYTVLTEFKFEVGNAIVNSEKVQGAVDGISASADRAMQSMKGLGIGLVQNIGLRTASVVGVLGEALFASDKFFRSQLVFSNIISSNMQNMTGDIDTFNDRLAVSARVLKDISKDAAKFGLPEQQLADTTKLLGATLAPKGLAGVNFSTARTMGRNLLKSAPTLGTTAEDSQGQLLRAIQGGASMGDPLFRSLSLETQVFKEKFKGATDVAKKFNALPLKERFQILNEGLGQFAKDSDVLAGNAQTISAMMTRLRDIFVGFNGILLPIGNVIRGPLIGAFDQLMSVLDNQGRRAVQGFAEVMKIMLRDVETTAVNLMQARRLGSDFKAAGSTLVIGTIIQFLSHMGLLGLIFKTLGIPLGFVLKGLGFLGPVFTFLGKALVWVGVAAAKFFIAMLPILAIFQTISRAMAIARINDMKVLPELMAVFAEQLARLGELFMIVFGPALQLMDTIAGQLAIVFEFGHWLRWAGEGMKFLTDVLVTVFALIRGFVFAIGQLVQNLSEGKILGAFGGVKQQFQIGVDDFFDQFLTKTQKPDGSTAVAENTTYISGGVHIHQDFKEKMEPDRVAFTIVDQINRVAKNPLSAGGRSIQRNLVAQ